MTRHSSMTSAGHMHAHVALVALTAVSCALTVGAQDGLTLWPVCGRFYGPVGNTPEPYVCQWNEETRCNHGYTGPRPDCDNICTVAAVKEFGYEKHTHWPAGSLLISLLSLRIYENEKCSLLTKFVHDSNPGNFTSMCPTPDEVDTAAESLSVLSEELGRPRSSPDISKGYWFLHYWGMAYTWPHTKEAWGSAGDEFFEELSGLLRDSTALKQYFAAECEDVTVPPTELQRYGEALVAQWRHPHRTSEFLDVCVNKGTASEDLYRAVTEAKDACMRDLAGSETPEAQCMLQNSYFMSDNCVDIMAEVLGFPAEDAIAAVAPLHAAHAQCRQLTTKEACNMRSSDTAASESISSALEGLIDATGVDGYSYRGEFFKYWEQFPQLLANGSIAVSSFVPSVPAAGDDESFQTRGSGSFGWVAVLGATALVALLN